MATEYDLGSVLGPKGDPGTTAYQYAQQAGYAGTEEEFGELLKKAASEGVVTLPELTTALTTKIDTVPTAPAGNVPVFDDNGQIVDSGRSASSIGDGNVKSINNQTPDDAGNISVNTLAVSDTEPTDPNVVEWIDTSDDAEIKALEEIGAVVQVPNPVAGNVAVLNDKGGIADGGIAASDLATWVRLYNDNLLINGDFTNPINQRGQRSYAVGANVYTIDRWRSNVGAAVEITDNRILVTTVQGKQWCGIAQFVEVRPEPGHSYTFSAECRNASGDGWYIDIQQYNTSTAIPVRGSSTNGTVWRSGLISTTLDIPDGESTNGTAFMMFICNSLTEQSTIHLTKAKLELGDHFTGFYLTDPATELAKCQRYYARSVWMESRAGLSGGNTFRLIEQFYPVQMRTSPTIRVLNPNGIARINTIDLSTNITNPTNDQIRFDPTIGIRNHRMFCPQFVLGSLPVKDYVVGISDGVYEFDAEIY